MVVKRPAEVDVEPQFPKGKDNFVLVIIRIRFRWP
jgi:hypothetical protein